MLTSELVSPKTARITSKSNPEASVRDTGAPYTCFYLAQEGW